VANYDNVMNIRILTFFFLLLGASVHAQKDLIVTQAGQEIRCKILEESSMRFTYAYINDKGKVLRTEIFKTLISNYKYNYYPEDVLPSEKIFGMPLKNTVAVSEQPETKKVKNTTKTDKKAEESAKIAEAKKKEDVVKEEFKDEIAVNDSVDKSSKSNSRKSDKKTELSKKEDKPVELSKESDSKPEVAKNDKAIAVSDDQKTDKEIDKVASKVEKKKLEEIIPEEEEKKSEFKNFLKYRVGLKGGLGNIMEENLNKTKYGLFKEKLLRGWVYGVDGSVFLNDNVGVGVTYNSYQSSSKASKLDFLFNREEGSRTYDEVFTKVNHKFVGPTLLYRMALDYKTFIVASASPGYIFYTERGTLETLGYREEYKYTGKTWGAAATLGIDFLIGDDNFGRDVILSFECGYNYGKIDKLNYGGTYGVQPLPNPINLQRLDFSIGLRFNRFPRYLR
jgi:hypothetical protein